MPTIVSGERPSFVAGVYTRPFLIKNSGNATVYLGQDSSLTVASRAFSIAPGGTLNWEGKTELWAIADKGSVSEMEVLYTGNTSSTPGPSIVGSRNVWKRVVDVSTTVVPPLGYLDYTVDDVTNYSTLQINIRGEYIDGNTPNMNYPVRVIIQWYGGPQEEYLMSRRGTIQIRTSVKGYGLAITVANNASGVNVPWTADYITASLTTAVLPDYFSHEYIKTNTSLQQTEGIAGAAIVASLPRKLVKFQFDVAANATGYWYLPHFAGVASLLMLGTAVRSVRLLYGDDKDAGGFSKYFFAADTSSNLTRYDVNMPVGPVVMEIAGNANAGTIYGNIIYKGA